MGSVFVEGSEGLIIDSCNWNRVDGNAIMLSGYNRNATISNSAFAWIGSTAIAAWGKTDEISDDGIHGNDGTSGDFPRYTLIEKNLFKEVGIWEKQSSAFFQAKAA